MMDTFQEIFEQKALAVYFEVFGLDVVEEMLRPDFEWDAAGDVIDVEMIRIYSLHQTACTLRGLALQTNVSVGHLKKAKLLNFWFDEELKDRHLETLAKTFVEEALVRINRFLLDPATGIMINPSLARNRFILPLLAKMSSLWSDEDLSEKDKAKMAKEYEKESVRLAKEIQLSTSGFEINKQLLKAIKMPKDQLKRKLKMEGISMKEIENAGTKKKIRIMKVLRAIKKAEVDKETKEMEEKIQKGKNQKDLDVEG